MKSSAHSRAPWWMWVLYTSFVAYAVFVVYNNTFGPEPIGAKFRFAGGRMILLSVADDTPASRAGLRPGDVIVRAAGIPIAGIGGWMAARAQVEVHVPQHLEVEREGKRFQAELVSIGRVRGGAVVPSSMVPLSLTLKLVSFALAFLLLWQRPRDKVALVAAWLIASGASATGMITTGMAASFRQLPVPLALLLVFPFFSNVSGMSTVLFTFCALFPRRLFRSAWPYVIAWIPAPTLFLSWQLPQFYRTVYRPEALRSGSPELRFQVTFIVFLAIAAAAIVALIINYRRLQDVNERRRVRVVVAGFALTWMFIIPLLYAFNLDPNHVVARLLLHPVTIVPVFLVVALSAPCSLVYAVLRHRVFDVSVIVRQGLQYAVARHALLALAPLMAVLLVGDLMAHRQQTVGDMLRARGWIYVVIGGLALFAHSQRERWLTALDRRFFRERYDAQRLLREVLEDVHRAAGLEAIAPTVTAKIEAALHPEFVALLARSPQGGYQTIACAPAGAAPLGISAEAKLIGILRLLEKPLEISSGQSSWLKEQLPHTETDWLRQAHLELLIPVALAPAQRETLLALGPKRSEEPYSGEDKEFLLSVAGSLRLLLERPAAAVLEEQSFRECPQCGLCAGNDVPVCPSDGAQLTVVGVPRLLGGRYRLERRIGRGGMGAVYRARDTALERDVAAKLIREELVGSAGAANRFRQEARAAAAFAHANVVTIHDFGVSGTRAFLIMELLQGRSLRQQIQHGGALEPQHALAVFRGACAAVDAAHRRGMIHRDLKPENIFLAQTDEGEVAKILDFGLVKSLTDETQVTRDTGAGVMVGTAPYFSPEQWRGEPADAAADCWALAVSMYEALFGAHPFPETTRDDLRRSVLAGAFRPPRHCHEFFRRALSPERANRPLSPSVLLADLERALSQAAGAAHVAIC